MNLKSKFIRIGGLNKHSYAFTLAWILGNSILFGQQSQVGRTAPELDLESWIQSEPLRLEDLRGRVVLLRWWTNGCPYCENSADALNEFYDSYDKDDFVVIGIYHTKPYPFAISDKMLRSYVRQKQFKFPVAKDASWENLNRYWSDDGPGRFTSVSFLIDQLGNIAFVHEGGEYHRFIKKGHEGCTNDYWELKRKIDQLLKNEP